MSREEALMILAIDTGNTHTVIGCISSEGEILQIMRIETNPHKTEHEYAAGMKLILEMGGIDLKNVEGAVISSVVPPLTHVLRRAVKYITGIDVPPLSPPRSTIPSPASSSIWAPRPQ